MRTSWIKIKKESGDQRQHLALRVSCSWFIHHYSKLSFKEWQNNTILHLHHGMQTSEMSNKPKLNDPFPLQTSIVLWRQIKTMFLGCKSSGPYSAQIKVVGPTGMVTSFCLNQSPGRIKKNNWNREKCTESELAVRWSLKSQSGTISLFPAGRLCSTRGLLMKF